jgi:1,4-dihydroxy-2-naphthoyl-CoA hydrolase
MKNAPRTAEDFNVFGKSYLPGLFGMEIVAIDDGRVHSRMPIRPEHLAPNGYLHAASVIALADTSCGYGTIIHLPEGAESFTTIELKSNFLGTARTGAIACRATRVHGGRLTQVWDAEVKDESNGRAIAVFRCTQMILYPRAQSPAT